MSYDDRRVCRPFLLSCCPHEVLTGTRVDMGDCNKVHEYALRADYERAAQTKTLYYEFDALEVLEQFIADCDRKTDHAKRKLRETQEELGEEAARKMNTIHELGEQIGTKLARAEEVGAQGLVDESMKLLEEVEQLRKAKLDAEQDFRATMPASTYQQQKLRVCEVCSAYLGIHDNDRRLADHFGGKLHLGFIQIREKLAALRARVSELKEKHELERKSRRNSPPPASSSSSRHERGGGGDRDKNDHYNRNHRSGRRSRSPSKKVSSRDKDRRRSRSRSNHRSSKYSRNYRSRSRDRRRYKRSRSRSGSSRRHRRSRSHSPTSSASARRHNRHRRDSRSPDEHRSSKSNGNEEQKTQPSSSNQPAAAAPPPPPPPAETTATVNHDDNDDDDDETTRLLESIQRSMQKDQEQTATSMD